MLPILEQVLELELIQSHMAQKPVLRGELGCACVAREVSVERGGMGERAGVQGALPEYPVCFVNDTELIQRGVFTEGRWRKQSSAEILALNTHIKRHPSVESPVERLRDLLNKRIPTT